MPNKQPFWILEPTDGAPVEILDTLPRARDKPQIPTEVVQRPSNAELPILNLLEDPPLATTITVMNSLWKHWDIKDWEELALFYLKDVLEFFSKYFKDTSMLHHTKTEHVIDFARDFDLTEDVIVRHHWRLFLLSIMTKRRYLYLS